MLDRIFSPFRRPVIVKDSLQEEVTDEMAKKTQPKKEELQVKPAPQPKLNPLYKKFLETCSMNEKKVYSENLLKGAGVFKKYVVELEDAELAKLIEG